MPARTMFRMGCSAKVVRDAAGVGAALGLTRLMVNQIFRRRSPAARVCGC
jgi:hypothetical protein